MTATNSATDSQAAETSQPSQSRCSPYERPRVEAIPLKKPTLTPKEAKKKRKQEEKEDKERFKEYYEARDKRLYEGSTAGYLAGFYKGKKGWAWRL
ncbi:uncharacterized protein GIQ15_06411 [Arthroderma uncinatum]|uniref:uncharacterized protein n=1 Tax=Arthroderma uncinatum TaxID=74035 RepID=UPI00144AD32D|nr:uncharacterized protein GIQ15_06411 [Arthroderma uncinatum]KAF3479435.1 hypothetical protein GIQ15_06411 [Arthroderma uncinatum]